MPGIEATNSTTVSPPNTLLSIVSAERFGRVGRKNQVARQITRRTLKRFQGFRFRHHSYAAALACMAVECGCGYHLANASSQERQPLMVRKSSAERTRPGKIQGAHMAQRSPRAKFRNQLRAPSCALFKQAAELLPT